MVNGGQLYESWTPPGGEYIFREMLQGSVYDLTTHFIPDFGIPPLTSAGWKSVSKTIQADNGSAVTAVLLHGTNDLCLFITGEDGIVWWNRYNYGNPDGNDWKSIPPNANADRDITAQPGVPLTCLWRPDHRNLDVFMTGTDGAVWWNSSPADMSWPNAWTEIMVNEIKANVGGPVNAVWRPDGNHIDLFMSGTDGRIWWASADADVLNPSQWTAIRYVDQNSIGSQPGAPITALWRPDGTGLDLFMSGTDGTVWWTWTTTAMDWPHDWQSIQAGIQAQKGGAITAVWRPDATAIDLLMLGNDGMPWWTWTRPGLAAWPHPWRQVHPNIIGNAGSTVTALWRPIDDYLDVFISGNDGIAWHNWSDWGGGWRDKWTRIGDDIRGQKGVTVTAVWDAAGGALNIFMTGQDGRYGTVWANRLTP